MPERGSTYAILLGASAFPNYPALEPSAAFANSKKDFLKYLTSKSGLYLDEKEDVLDLFNDSDQPGQLITKIKSFLKEKIASPRKPTDVIFYYCGHGAYLAEDEYFLALNCSDKESKEATVFKIKHLVDIISRFTGDFRNLVILDACYSGAALIEFTQGNANENAAQVVTNEFGISKGQRENEAQSQGVMLFCAAGPKKWAKTPLEATHTMFSGALLKILKEGSKNSGPQLTVQEVSDLMYQEIKGAFGTQAVQPQVHVPVQKETNLLSLLYFPNAVFNVSDSDERIAKLEATMSTMAATLGKQTTALDNLDRKMKDIHQQSPLVASPSPLESSRPYALGPRAVMVLTGFASILYLTIVDGITFLTLQNVMLPHSYAGGYRFQQATIPTLWFALSVHGVLAALAGLLLYIRSFNEKSLIVRAIERFMPPYVSPVLIIWNGALVGTILCYAVTVSVPSRMAELRLQEEAARAESRLQEEATRAPASRTPIPPR